MALTTAIHDYLRLIRPINCFMGAIGTVIAIFISGGNQINSYILGAITTFFAMAAGNALNDCIDIDIDRIAHPGRPLPSGRISRKGALYMATALFFLALAVSTSLGANVFSIVSVNILLMIFYELYAKNNPSGNIIISYLVGSIFLFGGAIGGQLRDSLFLFLLAFFATFGREIAKGIEDLEGDRGKRRTIALINLPAARYLSALFTLIAVALSALPYLNGIFSSLFYLIFIALADALFILCVIKIFRNEKSSTIMRYSMLIALLAFIGGAI
jgi:geranylgeranylglycerol-phosphate geranylgeranyltransferase